MQDPAIGIDLGTTNSCVGLFNPESQSVEILTNALGKTTTPSWVAKEEDEVAFVVGAGAEKFPNYYYEVKRIIGRSYDEVIKADESLVEYLPYELVRGRNGRCEIKAYDSDVVIAPEQISALILKEMKQIAERRCGREVRNAVITVPAYFNSSQKNATMTAAELAGLEVLRIINEPTAAAMACNFHAEEEEKNVLVFDFGGGTFDISILCSSHGMLDVQATRGDMKLGGLDLDLVILKMCEQKIREELTLKDGSELGEGGVMPEALEKMIRRSLRPACEQAKMTLSTEHTATIKVDKIVADHPSFDDFDFELEITRYDYEEAAEEVLARLEGPIREALKDAEMEIAEIDQVVVVGGSTRTPWVRQWLKDFFDTDHLYDTVNADEGVAYGATVMAGILSNQVGQDPQNQCDPQDWTPQTTDDGSHQTVGNVIVSDVSPLSLGIAAYVPGKGPNRRQFLSVMIKRNCVIPCEVEKRFQTYQANQTEIPIEVLQGEAHWAEDNHYLGKFTLKGLPARPKGTLLVNVIFKIDANGVLFVTANAVGVEGKEKNLAISAETLGLAVDRIHDIHQQWQISDH